MDDHTSGTNQADAYGRREILRRGAFVVGAATLWTTPVVQTLGMRPAAAGSHDGTETDGSLCPPGSESSAQPRDLIFRWNGAGASSALIVIQRPGSDRLCALVGGGGFFQVANQAGSQWRVGIYDPADTPSFGGAGRWQDLASGYLDHTNFHTSCSEPLSLGDSFGPVTLVAGTAPGDGQRQQELPGVSLSDVRVATANCSVTTTADEPETDIDELEAEGSQTEDVGTEELKTDDVEAEEGGSKPAQVEPEKVEDRNGEDDEDDESDVDASS